MHATCRCKIPQMNTFKVNVPGSGFEATEAPALADILPSVTHGLDRRKDFLCWNQLLYMLPNKAHQRQPIIPIREEIFKPEGEKIFSVFSY